MRTLIVAAAFVLTAAPAALAQVGFNPGTVVSNVYQNPAVAHGGFGLAPVYGYEAPRYRSRRERLAHYTATSLPR